MDHLDTPNASASPAPAIAAPTLSRTVFLGPSGLRAGWSLLLFLAIFAAEFFAVSWLLRLIFRNSQRPHATTMAWTTGLLQEASMLALLVLPVWVMSRIERKPFLSYGYSGAARTVRLFFGLLWGFAAISSLVLVLWKLGYLAFDGGMLGGVVALKYGAGWGLVFLTVGFFEESFLRGYIQYTLTRGIGFWWSAILLSCGFGAMHGTNAGESPIGLFGAGAVGLVFCLSLWYTGSLWWAVGFHAGWDWGQSFFYGTADSGLLAQGHLLTEHPVGNILWSGGATGPEGSVLALAVLAISTCAMVLWWGRRTASPFAGSAWKPRRSEASGSL